MFIASKIILKSVLLAAPFITATPAGNNSTRPPVSVTGGLVSQSSGTNVAQPTLTPAAPNTAIVKRPGHPDTTVTFPPGITKQEQLDLQQLMRHPFSQRSMTNIPKSYDIYLLYRSDGTLIGPNGIVPLKPQQPHAVPVTPAQKP